MRWLERWLYTVCWKKFHSSCLIGDMPFFDKHLFRGTKEFESSHDLIKKEVVELLKRYDELAPFQTMSPDQELLTREDNWKFFFLKCAAFRFKKNISLMPDTMRTVDRYPEIVSAYLSILAPGASLPPHRGPWSGILRVHLGVIIPPPNKDGGGPHILVDGEQYDWKEGEVVFFDDTYEHMAFNPTHYHRVVLFMDILRPMSAPWHQLNKFILSCVWMFPYFWIPYFRHKKWEKKFHG